MPDENDNTLSGYDYVPPSEGTGAWITIFEDTYPPRTIDLNDMHRHYGSPLIYGRQNADKDIELHIRFNSRVVSRPHGEFVRERDGKWLVKVYGDSVHGLLVNNTSVRERVMEDGDELRIEVLDKRVDDGVLMIFSTARRAEWFEFKIKRDEVWIGRNPDPKVTDICLKHISVSKRHAVILITPGKVTISDAGSQNGVIVNGKTVLTCEIKERDVIRITNTRLIYRKSWISCCTSAIGESIEANGLYQIKDRKHLLKKREEIMKDVSLRIEPGELVAIVGGSGAGKSTLIYMLCGLKKPYKGHVSIDGIDLYKNFDSIKTRIGYVPQTDIVQDNLTLRDMLLFTAKLRVPEDTPNERRIRVDDALKSVEMTKHADKYIKNISGGQRKRASIAVELLADPKLLFLDEPGSGLDPFTEESLMGTLKKMAQSGKTVVFVTHSPLSLEFCDKIAFIGTGGVLCFYGTYEQSVRFLCETEVGKGEIDPKVFATKNIVKVYSKTTLNGDECSRKFNESRKIAPPPKISDSEKKPPKKRVKGQTATLFHRNVKLYLNDWKKIIKTFGFAALLAFFVTVVENGFQHEKYGITKSLYFALSCAVFFVGCSNAITEVCKERNLIKREYMTTLSLGAYISAKTALLLILCAINSLIFASVFAARVGMTEAELLFAPFLEILLTIFLTGLAGSAIGMFVSCLSKNEDAASKLAPILILPQILFSGVIFELGDGFVKHISYIVTARWAMEAFGSFVNLNDLSEKLNSNADFMFEFTQEHAAWSLFKLALFPLVFCSLSFFALKNIRNSKE